MAGNRVKEKMRCFVILDFEMRTEKFKIKAHTTETEGTTALAVSSDAMTMKNEDRG